MKGVSAIIVTVILIACTITLASAMATWFFSAAKTAANSMDASKAADCSPASSSVKILGVFAGGGSNRTVRVMVQNSGFTDNLTITSALVYNISGHSVPAQSLPVWLNHGESAVLVFANVSMDLCPYSFDRAVVATNCEGVIASYQHQPVCS